MLVMTSLEKEGDEDRESVHEMRLVCCSATSKVQEVCEDGDARRGSSFCTVLFRTTLLVFPLLVHTSVA